MHHIAIDTETGGLFPSIHALLAIGAACSWSPVTFEAYILPESQPGKKVDPEAAAKNGYSPEAWQLLHARSLDVVMGEFIAWIYARKKERPAAVLVCHHLAFDKPFLAEAARLCGNSDLPHRHDWRCSQIKFGELMDLMLIEQGSSSLDRLIALSNWPGVREEKHNARQDAEATLHGYAWLIEKAKTPEATLRHLYNRCLIERKNLEATIAGQAEGLPPQPKPCPCGCDAPEVKGNGIGDFYVECPQCHRRSEQRACEWSNHAIERWNSDYLEGADYDG